MFSALGVAMAQFGGAFTGQPNVAMQFVNNQIDRSIRAQEAQINVKGNAADNMLADLTREMGSLSAAKAVETWSAFTNGKNILTVRLKSTREGRPLARDNRERRSRLDDRRSSHPGNGEPPRKGGRAET